MCCKQEARQATMSMWGLCVLVSIAAVGVTFIPGITSSFLVVIGVICLVTSGVQFLLCCGFVVTRVPPSDGGRDDYVEIDAEKPTETTPVNHYAADRRVWSYHEIRKWSRNASLLCVAAAAWVFYSATRLNEAAASSYHSSSTGVASTSATSCTGVAF